MDTERYQRYEAISEQKLRRPSNDAAWVHNTMVEDLNFFFFGRSSTNKKLFENADFDWVRGQYSCLPDPIPSNPPPQVK